MQIPLRTNESIMRQGHANLQRGWETVGGKLFLTNQRLYFSSHSFNVQSGPTSIELTNNISTELCWTKFLGYIPLAPNSLLVQTNGGLDYRFVLHGRQDWASAINKCANGARA